MDYKVDSPFLKMNFIIEDIKGCHIWQPFFFIASSGYL